MSNSYDPSYIPPIPTVQIFLASPGERPSHAPFEAILDTGADNSILPESLAESINATALYASTLSSQWDDKHAVNMYMVEMEIETLRLPNIVVAGDPQSDEIILGRNVLNKLPLLLDGPEQQTEIIDAATMNRIRARRGQ